MVVDAVDAISGTPAWAANLSMLSDALAAAEIFQDLAEGMPEAALEIANSEDAVIMAEVVSDLADITSEALAKTKCPQASAM